jgi:predicted regulator of Ras-like GTPase activity (Roadblock/LC7/MglB family)
MITTKVEKKENKFQTALEYLIEYQGVKGAIIFDREGLVIDYLNRDDIDAEMFSSLALLILDQVSGILNKLGERPVSSMVVKNQDSWITIERINDLLLVVRAGNNTDELLKVRIGQAVDMVRTYVKEKYPLLAK